MYPTHAPHLLPDAERPSEFPQSPPQGANSAPSLSMPEDILQKIDTHVASLASDSSVEKEEAVDAIHKLTHELLDLQRRQITPITPAQKVNLLGILKRGQAALELRDATPEGVERKNNLVQLEQQINELEAPENRSIITNTAQEGSVPASATPSARPPLQERPSAAPAAAPDKWSAMVNSVSAFIGTIAKKIEYWQHQLAYHFAPLVEQLKKIKIPFLGIDFSSQIGAFEQFVGLDSIMISASLRKVGLVPVFNSEHPEKDTEAIHALTKTAEEAKKKNKNCTSQDFYDAVALRHADSLQGRGAEAQEPSGRKGIRLSELVPFAQTVIAGIPASSEQPAQPQRAAEATSTAATSPEEITFPAAISFERFKNGVQIGSYHVKVVGSDRIDVGTRKWKLEGKEGSAAGARMEITNVEWRDKKLQFEVKGTKYVFASRIENNVLSEEATARLLNHLASSGEAYRIHNANGTYVGVDIVPA